MGLVISLCDYTGNIVKPWLEAGHKCVIVDIQHATGKVQEGNLVRLGFRVEELRNSFSDESLASAIVFAFPPCTDVAVTGAKHFQSKGLSALIRSLTTLEACISIAERGKAWCIENPVSTFSSYWRKPDHIIHPFQYASQSDNYANEAYSKRTCLWVGGGFIVPKATDSFNINPHYIHYLGSAGQAERSVTPLGFAYAVYAANKHLLET